MAAYAAMPQLMHAQPLPVPSMRPPAEASDSDPDDDKPGGDAESRKRKRNRVALSCIQCKRRKVKCSRTSPCEACVRHGIPDECKWTEGSSAEQAQPFALAVDLRTLEARYTVLERYVVEKLASNGGELASLLAAVGVSTPASEPSTPARTTAAAVVALGPDGYRQSLIDAARGEAGKQAEEDAAQVLENLAMGPAVVAQPVPVRRTSGGARTESAVTTIMLQQSLEDSPDFAIFPGYEVLGRVLGSLPRDAVVWELLRAIDHEVMFIGVFHQPTLHAEVAEFLEARARNDLNYIDPAWLAFFLALLCCGVSEVGDYTPIVAGAAYADLQKMTPFWRSASRAALNLSQYFVTPQFRAIGTCILYIWLGVLPLASPHRDRGVDAWAAAAVRGAQSLGYHNLGRDETTMPPDDPGLPLGDCALKRQMALRVWHQLVCLDTLMCHGPPHLLLIRAGEHDSAMPANVTDEDLQTREVHVKERPRSELTTGGQANFKSAAMEAFRMAVEVHQRTANMAPEQAAQAVLDLDRKLRSRLDSNHDGPRAIPRAVQNNLRSGVLNRVLRSHRPFAERAYAGDVRFDESMRAYVACAVDICAANRKPHFFSMTFITRHIMAAVLALCQHRYGMIDRGMADRDAVETAAALDQAATALSRWRAHKFQTVRTIAEKGINLILGMREAEAAYRAHPRREPFVAVLKRVAGATFASPSAGADSAMSGGSTSSAGPLTPFDTPAKGTLSLSGAPFPPSGVGSQADGVASYARPLGLDTPLVSAESGFGLDNLDLMSGATLDWATLLSTPGPYDAGAMF